MKCNINCILTRSKHPSVTLALSYLIFSATNEEDASIIIILEMRKIEAQKD